MRKRNLSGGGTRCSPLSSSVMADLTASRGRFQDPEYKNWLKTTLCLQLVRGGLSKFLETETGKFHDKLLSALSAQSCQSNCQITSRVNLGTNKVPILCPVCNNWISEILSHHNNKKGQIYWNNCIPYHWSKEKWEVAKVYMPKGNTKHSAENEFDISAVLTYMSNCKYFTNMVKNKRLTEVTYVRNQMMHSATMKVSTQDMTTHISKVQALLKELQTCVPELKEIDNEIVKLQTTELNLFFEEMKPELSDGMQVINSVLDKQKFHDLEQQILKEKIEILTLRLEETKDGAVNQKELSELKEFLENNKDLLELLNPYMAKLDEIQVKVTQHDEQLDVLGVKVDRLEKISEEPIFSVPVLKNKNHLLELAQEKRWPMPDFSSIRHTHGYIGEVTVNGKKYKGLQVHPNKKAAHQEVSRIAYDRLMLEENTDASSTEEELLDMSKTGPSLFFVRVTVHLKNKYELPDIYSEVETAENASYEEFAKMFNMETSSEGKHKLTVLEFCNKSGFNVPNVTVQEIKENKFKSLLQICGPFRFQNKVGCYKKKEAEQDAAKEALMCLTRVLQWNGVCDKGNYKGKLLELLALTIEGRAMFESVDGENMCTQDTKVTVSKDHVSDTSQTESAQLLPNYEPQQVPAVPPGFFAVVCITLNKIIELPETFPVEEEAIQAIYRDLLLKLGLECPNSDKAGCSAKQKIQSFFKEYVSKQPEEIWVSLAEKTFQCKLDISGQYKFCSIEPSSKKQMAEQEAARKALFHLSGILGSDGVCNDKNYKGMLQVLLERQRQAKPTYQSCDGKKEEDVTDKGISSNAVGPPRNDEDSTASLPSISAEASMEDISASQAKMKKLQTESSTSTGEGFHVSVCFTLKKIIELPETFNDKEEARRAIYQDLFRKLDLLAPESETIGYDKEQPVTDFLRKYSSNQPAVIWKETAEKKIQCKLDISGQYRFCNPYPSPKKQKAEQEAAKEALTRLSAVLGWNVNLNNENYKGTLQTLITQQGSENPTYKPFSGDTTNENDSQGSLIDAPSSSKIHEESSTLTSVKRLAEGFQELQGTTRKQKIESSMLQDLLERYQLVPPHVSHHLNVEKSFVYCAVIQVEKLLVKTEKGSSSRKDAKRSTYSKLGKALDIVKESEDDPVDIVSKVKSFCREKNYDFPVEEFTTKDKHFICELTCTLKFSYLGNGTDLEEAQQEASRKALSRLAEIFEWGVLAKVTNESPLDRLTHLLQKQEQSKLTFESGDTKHKAILCLDFKDFSIQSKKHDSKKAAQQEISDRLLRLLEHDSKSQHVLLQSLSNRSSSSPSSRNRVQEWFAKQGLTIPHYEDTTYKHGAKLTFSAKIQLTHKDAKPTWELTEEELLRELKACIEHIVG
ncbi:uncharacterized protein LOC120523627 isoform X2 [Polypterus senegalus]|uniref:uncharacterized protein LOC120523627 isoform X2 n=1 Tax=Polypterus senegalus TaxID=55291 RepID=UPI001964EC66|nr:uncharacterized protein LOC120523627 isoform X2 [Polypterus senegalus]